jgi:hypothetical protein
MNRGLFAVLAAAVIGVTGCVNTVNDQQTGGVHLSRDKIEGRYQFPLNTVFEASKRALQSCGQVSSESNLLGGTNQVRALQGQVGKSTVWIRVEAVTPQVTSVLVQARTSMGSDIETAHEVEKRVALELAR